MAVWALRCASADRVDFFKASFQRRSSGDVEVMGGGVREPYRPDEVWIVNRDAIGEVRDFVRGVQGGMRSVMRGYGGDDDIAFAKARDHQSVVMVTEMHANDILRRCCTSAVDWIGVNPL